MSTIKYTGPAESVVLADGTAFERGKPVEVDAGLAKSLLEQDTFERPKPARKPAAKKADPKTEPEATAPDEDPASADDPPQEG